MDADKHWGRLMEKVTCFIGYMLFVIFAGINSALLIYSLTDSTWASSITGFCVSFFLMRYLEDFMFLMMGKGGEYE